MNILKRFEVWVLLILVGGVLAFVLITGGDPDGDPATTGPGQGAPGDPDSPAESLLSVTATHLKRDYGNGVLEIHITYDNRTGSDLELVPPTARLFAGPGPEAEDSSIEVEPFILAFSPPPTLPPRDGAAAVLKYWVEKEHLEGALWLRILDDTGLVKSAAPLDLKSIPNQETAVFEGTDWVAKP